MGIQTLLPTDLFPVGWEGSPARDDVDPTNRHNTSTVAIPFGRFVSLAAVQVQGQAGNPTVEMVSAATVLETIDGIAAWSNHETTLSNGALTAPGGYPAYAVGDETISVYKTGYIWVHAEDDVDPTSPVYVRIDGNANDDDNGRVRGTEIAGETILLPSSMARFKSTALAGELVILSIQIV